MIENRGAFNQALERWIGRRRRMFYPKTDVDFDIAEMRRRKEGLAKIDLSGLPGFLDEEVRSIEFMPNAGTFNALFRIVTPENRYVLKLSAQDSAFEFAIDQWANRALRSVALSVIPRSLPCPFMVIEEAQGRPLTTFEDPQTQAMPEPLIFEFGSALARHHHVPGYRAGLIDCSSSGENAYSPDDYPGPAGLHATWREYLLLRLDDHIRVCREIGAIDDSEVARIEKHFSSTPQANISRMLHGDPGHHNVFSDGQKITAIIDWEDALTGDPIFDIAYWGTFVRDEMRARFLEGYQSVEKLPADFEHRYWLYYLRIALSKTVHRHRFGTKDRPGRPPASLRIQKALSKLTEL